MKPTSSTGLLPCACCSYCASSTRPRMAPHTLWPGFVAKVSSACSTRALAFAFGLVDFDAVAQLRLDTRRKVRFNRSDLVQASGGVMAAMVLPPARRLFGSGAQLADEGVARGGVPSGKTCRGAAPSEGSCNGCGPPPRPGSGKQWESQSGLRCRSIRTKSPASASTERFLERRSTSPGWRPGRRNVQPGPRAWCNASPAR
jgi:hypothetical protein